MMTMQLKNKPLENGAELFAFLNEIQKENNSVMAGNDVHFLFRNHYVNTGTGKHGLRALIAEILEENGSVLEKYNKDKHNRNLYLAMGMTTDDIDAKVRECFGHDRYPSILDCLGRDMEGQAASIQMKAYEDTDRTCKRPRKLWYLIKNKK